jgi:leader peptidase (prepilin peptidase)/N-methyltransferase
MPELRIIFAIFSFMLGAIFASFAGVVAYRLPKGLSIVKPDSYCPSCNKPIKFYDNIPILSWIILGGKCRGCKAKIGVFSLLMEIFGGLGFMFAYLQYGEKVKTLPVFIALMLLVFLFVIIAGIDHETHEIYNVTLILYAAIAVFITLYRAAALRADIWEHVFGAIFGFGFFLAIKLVAKIVLKKDALGSGDIYLVGIGGFIVGVLPLLLSIIIATFLGSIIEIIKIKTSKSERDAEIAFGPYLLLGIGLMSIFGEILMKFYWEVLL